MDSSLVIAIAVIILFGAFLLAGIPLFVCLSLASFIGFLVLGSWELASTNMISIITNFVSNYVLTVIPIFIFMGNLAYQTRILEDVFKVAETWFGRLKGGLAISTVAANAIFAACSGSSMSATLVIGKEAFPLMRKNGYPDTLSSGVIAASGTLASLIPPSILLCIYALMVEQSVGKLLIAGIIPGIVSAVIYSIYVAIFCLKIPINTEIHSLKAKIGAIRHLWVVVILVFAIMYSMYNGWATPTEAGAVGACVIFILATCLKRMSWKVIFDSIRSTAFVTGQILIVVGAAIYFGRFLVFSGISVVICEAFIGLDLPRVVIFMLVTILYLGLGCFMGAVGMMAVSLPIIYPIMMSLGYDPLWFGIIIVIFSETALISPPIGMNVYAAKSVVGDVPLTTIFKGCFGFMCMDVLTVFVLYLFPSIITFLPSLM